MMRSESGNWAGKRWEIDYIFFDRQTDEQHTFFVSLDLLKKIRYRFRHGGSLFWAEKRP